MFKNYCFTKNSVREQFNIFLNYYVLEHGIKKLRFFFFFSIKHDAPQMFFIMWGFKKKPY